MCKGTIKRAKYQTKRKKNSFYCIICNLCGIFASDYSCQIMKILIFDTDVQNYHFICSVLEDYDVRYEVIGPFTTIEQCRDYLLRHKDIDIIITDVMLGNDLVFDVLNIVPNYVPIVFVTSYEEYALKAFEYHSLSYLIKPVEEADLIKKYHRLDIHNPGTLLSIMRGYSFMCAVIVDEAMERVDMLWDDGGKSFETYSFMSLEREESSGMYKKVINMVSKR